MHGVDGDHGIGQAKRTEQGLHGGNLIGLVITVDVRQHQSRAGSEGAEQVRGTTAVEVIEAAPQGLAVNRYMTMTFDRGRAVKRRGVAAESRLDRGGVKLPQNPADRRVGWRSLPFHPECIPQLSQVNIDEAVDRPIGISTGNDCQDREQNHMGQPVEFALRSSWIFDLGQQGNKWRKRPHGNPIHNKGCQPDSQMDPRRRNPLSSGHSVICKTCCIADSVSAIPPKKRALNSPDLAVKPSKLSPADSNTCLTQLPDFEGISFCAASQG